MPGGYNEGFHNSKGLIISNHWDFKSIKDLQTDLNIGHQSSKQLIYELQQKERPAKLFQINHFVTPYISGNPQKANEANSYKILKDHIKKFHDITGHYPNFIHIDFYDQNFNDLKKIAAELNTLDIESKKNPRSPEENGDLKS